MNLTAEIYTDGSCHTQKCFGAWAAFLLFNNQKIILSGSEVNTTHNRMEILAVIKAFQYLELNFPETNKVIIVSDSQYVVGLMDRQAKFENSNFKTKANKDIRNIDLVKEILGLISKFDVEFIKIKAHQKPTSIVNYNIEVDKLSRKLVREGIN